MEAKSTGKRWTYSEFARLPPSGSTRYEIIDDELVVTPAPTPGHQRVITRLLVRIAAFAQRHDLGEAFPAPLDVLFAEGDYFEPDVLFVRKDRLDLLSDRGMEGPPDLVIEIVSPSTGARDRGIKLDRYRLYGVPEYWVVDADAGTLEVWTLSSASGGPDLYGASDTLKWTPNPGGPTLEIEMADILEG